MAIFPKGTRVQINPDYTQELATFGKVYEVVEHLPSDGIMGSKYKVQDSDGVERFFRDSLLVRADPAPVTFVGEGTVSKISEIIQQHSIVAFSHDYGNDVPTRITQPTLHCECGETFEGVTFAAHATHIAIELYNSGLR